MGWGGGGGDQKHKIMDRLFMPKYGTVSQVNFSNWLSHLEFTLTSDFHVLNSLNEDHSDIFSADISLSLIANCLKTRLRM